MITLRNYQNSAVNELLEKSFKLLGMGKRKVLTFKAPTGAGKTIMTADWLKQMMEQLPEAPLSQKQFAFFWLAPQKLHTQSLLSLSAFFEEYRTLRCLQFNDVSGGALANGDILFMNWASINKENNIYIRDNEQGNNLQSILAQTRKNGIEIIVIIDEAHFGGGAAATRARNLLSMVDASLEVEVSATPERSGDELVNVHRSDVIKEEMIKKGIKLNSGLIPKNELSLNQYLLDEALKQQRKIAKAYEKQNSPVKPLLLIQLPSETAKESSLDKSIREEIELFLKSKNITVENGKLAVWLSEDKSPNLSDIESNDSLVEAMIFKQAVALGWDCPRASVLAIYREIQTTSFGIQTVGRILRMPEQKHYGDDTLDYGYVFTNLESKYVEFVNEDAQFFNQIHALRKADVPSLLLCKEYLNSRTDRKRLKSTVLKKAFRSAAHINSLEFFAEGEGEFIEHNLREWSVRFNLNPQKIEVTIPKDMVIDHNKIEIKKQSIVEEKNKLRYAKTLAELEMVARKIVRTFCGDYEKVEGGAILLQRMIEFLEEYFCIPELDAYKVIAFEGNARAWEEFIVGSVLKEYERIAQIMRAENPPTKIEQDWEWPAERFYNADVFQVSNAIIHTLEPFCREIKISSPEQKFVEFLESNQECIQYWYKNGDSGKEHFSVAYKDRFNVDRLFYVDFIILFKDGTKGLFDTKTKGSDENMAQKHNALLDYMTKHNETGEKLIGGVIVEESHVWVYPVNKLATDSAIETRGWATLNPKNYCEDVK